MTEDLYSIDEFYFQWHITERCNKHCSHCYQNGHPVNDLPLSDLEKIIDCMDEALVKWDRQGSLSFTGGEPFIRQNELFTLMRRIDEIPRFEYYDILTNGSLITDDVVHQLSNLSKLRRVQVSLEGSTPEINDAIRGKGSLRETVNAIRKMKEKGLTVSVMTTLSRFNYRDIPALIYLLNDESVDTFALERLIPEGRGQSLSDQLLSSDELRDLYEQIYTIALQKNGTRILMYRPLFTLVAPDDPTAGALCSIGNNAMTIMPDGTVYPCRRLPIPIGNILKDGIFSIWYNSEVLWNIRNPDNLKGKCRECDYLASCRGCRAMAYFDSGDYMAEDPLCWKTS